MVDGRFRALVVQQAGREAELRELAIADLPVGDVLVRVTTSSLNYKDALAVTARGPVVRAFPMVPGIDLAGEVLASESAAWPVGSRVFATGQGLGEERWGGFAGCARLSGDMLQALPSGRDARWAMRLGTAGLTAMLAVLALEEHALRRGGTVAVTGACGGVGSLAVHLLARRGYQVCAVTGRRHEEDWLRRCGASLVLAREAVIDSGSRPLAPVTWDAAIDTVGGAPLAGVLARIRPGGSVAACGMAAGAALATSVWPFILRGICLLGIDSVWCPRARREQAWRAWDAMDPGEDEGTWAEVATIGLHQVVATSYDLLAGRQRGRCIVDLGGGDRS